MSLVTKLLAATAMVAALGAPAMALDVNAGAGVGITLHDNNGHNGGPDTSGLDLSLDGNAAVADSSKGNADVSADAAANVDVAADADERAARFLGRSVISADGQVIGTVSQSRATADGGAEVVVALADGIQSEARQFSLDLAAEVSADADLKLGWTQAELLTNLDAQAKADANG